MLNGPNTVTHGMSLRQNNQIYSEILLCTEREMSTNEKDVWTKSPKQPGYYKAILFESQLGQLVLSDLAMRYPKFKPKYLQQDHFNDELPDMVSVYAIGPGDVFVDILDDNGIPRPQDHHNDIAGVTYLLTGDVLEFVQGYTFYDFSPNQQPRIRPDMLEFNEIYQQLKQVSPETVAMIEHFATIYEKQLVGYNGIYEPLALRELLWNFAQTLTGVMSGQNN